LLRESTKESVIRQGGGGISGLKGQQSTNFIPNPIESESEKSQETEELEQEEVQNP